MALIIEQLLASYLREQCKPLSNFAEYVQFVEDQNEDATSVYWRKKMQGATAPVFLAAEPDFVPCVDGYTELQIKPRQQGIAATCPPSLCIQAAWAMVMARYSDLEDIGYDVTLSGRTSPLANIEVSAGPIISTVRYDVASTGRSLWKPCLSSSD